MQRDYDSSMKGLGFEADLFRGRCFQRVEEGIYYAEKIADNNA
jgi:hypothetical protein